MTLFPKIEAEFRIAEAAGETHQIVHEREVEKAAGRVLSRIALGTFPDDLFQRVKTNEIFLEDIRAESFEGTLYCQDIVQHLKPEQLSQLIAYFAMTPLTLANRPGRVFVRLYDEEAQAFRIEELPSADTIKPRES